MDKPLIVLAAGGTGGHIFPAQALIEEIKKHNIYNIMLICDIRANKYIKIGGIKQLIIPSSRLSGNIKAKFIGFINIMLGLLIVLFHFICKRPKLVVGFGGYPSFPTLVIAKLLRIPVIIHEQNAVLGRVNQIFQSYATKLALGFPDTKLLQTKFSYKTIWLGNPIREKVMEFVKKPSFYKKNKETKILIIGGSQGSEILSKIVSQVICKLPNKKYIQLVHQVPKSIICGIENLYKNNSINYTVANFFDNIGDLIQKADIVIARAGAMTISELAALGKASILIPLAIAMDNHQYHNAMFMVNKKAAILIEERKLTIARLHKELSGLMQDKKACIAMQKNAKKLAKIDATDNLYHLIDLVVRDK